MWRLTKCDILDLEYIDDLEYGIALKYGIDLESWFPVLISNDLLTTTKLSQRNHLMSPNRTHKISLAWLPVIFTRTALGLASSELDCSPISTGRLLQNF
jgi:hypothetical protein